MNKPKNNVGFISLGCPKALVDSERIITQLRSEGYGISSSYEDADLVVVNTCGFIDPAIQESLETIGEALDENGKVIVTGCLGVDAKTVTDQFPQVLAVSGPHAYQEVMSAVHKHLPPEHDPYADLVPKQGIKLTPPHYAYLKISEGCNHRCSFCIIPHLRGDLVSRPINEVMQEAENLVNAGTKELLIISQDTSAYGVDMKYRTGFWNGRPVKTRFQELAESLGSLDAWVRLHYVYPYPHVDKVLPLMADNKILPYLDIPFQHASHSVLKNMRRPAHAENVLKRLQQWRETVPDIAIRSTFIVGFPGETEDDFQTLLSFLQEARLDRVGAFTYSAVEGADANELANPVDEDEKQERLEQLMNVQAEISAEKLQEKIGLETEVMVDGMEGEHIIARSKWDAPEVDGTVVIERSMEANPGDIIKVRITAADQHDLFAEFLKS